VKHHSRAAFSFRGLLIAATASALALSAGMSQARVTRIEVDQGPVALTGTGQTIAYEQISGRAFGELDPAHPLNSIIQDIGLAADADGKVRYVASFVLSKPVDMRNASGLMWHDVPNRGTSIVINVIERNNGDIGLASAWQGDNAAINASNGTAVRPTMAVDGRHWLKLPVVKYADGSTVKGLVFGRIVNRTGLAAQPLIVQTNPVPYLPYNTDLASTDDVLVSRDGESMEGVVDNEQVIPRANWKFCGGGTYDSPAPLTALPVQVCLKGGFDATKLYQVTYTAKDPYPLGVGFAAWRDVAAFFKTAASDDSGWVNPVANSVRWSIARGSSQSGNFLRGWLHLGFNQQESGARLHDGMWPIIAGRRIALNFRWAQPDGVLELYQAGSEGPQWWHKFPDHVRGLPPRGILDRCEASNTCPKVIEHFGSAEVWALKLTPEWVGTDAKNDIPLPDNVRRYYIASTTHGGTNSGNPINSSLAGSTLAPPANCPGNNFGTGILAANPLPHTQVVNAIRFHFRNWVMNGTPPPDSKYPTLRGPKGDRLLVEPTKAALGFPTIPLASAPAGWRTTVPEPGFINPVLDYDWGPAFDPSDATGVPTNVPPPIKQVITTLAPRTDTDGNELGGVPQPLLDVPLGTYLGWNITAGGARPFHEAQLCDYVGGMIPFAKTKQERMDKHDPRRSLEERYGDHDGYVNAMRAATAKAVAAGFMLQDDADALVAQALASNVLK
jgi:hypothetical protein